MRQQPIFARTVFGARLLACVLVVAAVPVVGGCDGSPSEEELQGLFDQGEFLCREVRLEEARVVLREFLLYRPNHAGAHFYLGRAYLLFRPVIAEGELQTALELFIEGGRISTIKRFGHNYFELICNIESAKACLNQIDLMLARGAPPAAAQPMLERAERYIREADAVMPGAEEVGVLEQKIAPYRTLRSYTFPRNRNRLDAPTKV